MRRRILPFLGLLLLLGACQQPRLEYADFDTFRVLSVKSSSLFDEDGWMNPEIQTMNEAGEPQTVGAATKVAKTNVTGIARDLFGTIHSNDVIQIAGTYTGHDLDGSPLTQSGKLILPASGPIKNMVIVSHFTIGANNEAPSEAFPMEGIFAAKGYAVVVADYLGFGVTADRIHPYLHTRSTVESVVDMALAVKPFLKHIGRAPQDEQVILVGYSQGGATTMAAMAKIQREYKEELPIKKTYAGGGPYDLCATFDTSMEWDETGIPCAIPMIVQGISEGEGLGLQMKDFFKPDLLAHYDEWINSKKYTVKEINRLINSSYLHEFMTDEGRDKSSAQTASLYRAMLSNSTLNFQPTSPVYMFHSRDDRTVPFVNAERAERAFKFCDMQFDFDHYGEHGLACLKFIIKVYKAL